MKHGVVGRFIFPWTIEVSLTLQKTTEPDFFDKDGCMSFSKNGQTSA